MAHGKPEMPSEIVSDLGFFDRFAGVASNIASRTTVAANGSPPGKMKRKEG